MGTDYYRDRFLHITFTASGQYWTFGTEKYLLTVTRNYGLAADLKQDYHTWHIEAHVFTHLNTALQPTTADKKSAAWA